MIRYKKRKNTRVWRYDVWNQNAEPGDLMVDRDGRLFRLEESTGFGKRGAGELTPRLILPPVGMRAIIKAGEVYWQKEPPHDAP